MVFMFDIEKMLEQQLKEVEQWHEELPQESSSESVDFNSNIKIGYDLFLKIKGLHIRSFSFLDNGLLKS